MRQLQPDYIRLQELFALCIARWRWFVFSLVVSVGLAAACDYLKEIGLDTIREHDLELLDYAITGLKSIGAEALRELAAEENDTEVACQFCGRKYMYCRKDLLEIAEKAEKELSE